MEIILKKTLGSKRAGSICNFPNNVAKFLIQKKIAEVYKSMPVCKETIVKEDKEMKPMVISKMEITEPTQVKKRTYRTKKVKQEKELEGK